MPPWYEHVQRSWWWGILAGLAGIIVDNTPLVIYVLFSIMALDVLSGLARSAVLGKINRQKAWHGALRKVLIVSVVSAAALVQLVLKLLLEIDAAPFVVNIPTEIPLTEFTAGLFIIYEFVSILENSMEAGVRLPVFLRRILEQGQEDAEQR